MGQLRLQSQVFHAPGAWGIAVPVTGASIEITDIDRPGAENDRIWTGTTDADGRFSGTSSEWLDGEPYRVPVADSLVSWHWEEGVIPDASDILALQVRISAPGHEIILPYVCFNDDMQTPALEVPWGPSGEVFPFVPADLPIGVFEPSIALLSLATVNGHACATPADVSARVRAEIGKKEDAIRIDLFDPIATQLVRSANALEGIAEWAGGQLGIPSHWLPANNDWLGDDAAGLSVGCAVVKHAAGLNPLLVNIGVAVIYGVHHGYPSVKVDGGARTRGPRRPGVRFTLTQR